MQHTYACHTHLNDHTYTHALLPPHSICITGTNPLLFSAAFCLSPDRHRPFDSFFNHYTNDTNVSPQTSETSQSHLKSSMNIGHVSRRQSYIGWWHIPFFCFCF